MISAYLNTKYTINLKEIILPFTLFLELASESGECFLGTSRKLGLCSSAEEVKYSAGVKSRAETAGVKSRAKKIYTL